jgi:phosphoenolpyruvate synthase/pyruvate phosphate dikinase
MAADPDLIPMIRRAAAVVTQEGGVTSHASVLCREIGVPTIIGVEDLLDFVRDGDEVEVDAARGIVRLIREDREQIGKGVVVPHGSWGRPECVGRKAANLQVALKRGFKVPAYTLLSFEETVRMLDEDEGDLRRKLIALSATLDSNPIDTSSFLLRSSALNEDSERGSQAGTYVSVPFSITADPIAALREFVERNRRLGYCGAIILQRFLGASFSGVSVDSDPLADAKHRLVVEFVRGPLNTVTTGQGQIERLVYDRTSGEIIVAADAGRTQSSIDNFPAGDLIEWLYSVGRVFGMPAYTEWGYYRGDYWLYQVRGAMS